MQQGGFDIIGIHGIGKTRMTENNTTMRSKLKESGESKGQTKETNNKTLRKKR